MKGWMLSYKHPDTERMFSRTYLNEESAYRDAAASIRTFAEYDIVSFGNDYERREDLKEILNLLVEGKNKDAYERWREYADDSNPEEDVMIEDTEIVEE